MTLTRRFTVKYSVLPNSCWLWTAATNASGYGIIWADGPKLAHRVSYELHRGPIPQGLKLDHLCRIRSCVNPDHLEPVTVRENNVRGVAPNLAKQRAAAVSHCPQGHPYDEENTYVGKQTGGKWPSRKCRACNRERSRRNRLALR